MVTKSSQSVSSSGPTPPLQKPPTKIEPPELATNASANPKYQADPPGVKKDNPASKDASNSFKLPEKVTQKEIRDGSFKYGGGRSAGNRSLADNMARKLIEP